MDDIEQIEKYISTIEHVRHGFGAPTSAAMGRAVFALEKQIPKKPKDTAYHLFKANGWQYECPSCGNAVGENKNAEDYTQEDDFCPSCGQKLDWSAVK